MNNIKAEIVADSLSPQGNRLTSVLCTFPRIILAEVNTHRMLSKNTSSSRAIPFEKMVKAVEDNPFIPIAWQKDHKGMQGSEYLSTEYNHSGEHAIYSWLEARNQAIRLVKTMKELEVTKQLCNRLLEPFMWTTMLITGSEEGWENFFNLRCPQYELAEKFGGGRYKSKKEFTKAYLNVKLEDTAHITNATIVDWLRTNKGQAEIHMMALAEAIYDSMNESTPEQLQKGQWHIPFFTKLDNNKIAKLVPKGFYDPNNPAPDSELIKGLERICIKVSTALTARTSYTVVGDEKEVDYKKMIELYDRLVSQSPPHSSPLEHCSRAMSNEEYNYYIKGEAIIDNFDIRQGGYTTEDIFEQSSKGWCRNYKGFIQLRHLIENGKSI